MWRQFARLLNMMFSKRPFLERKLQSPRKS
jgi:hypothetical protein